jgi:Cryptococcal mannosyltransferase 1
MQNDMSRRPLYTNERASPDRESFESSTSFDLTPEDPESQVLFASSYSHERPVSSFDRLQSSLHIRGLNFSCSKRSRNRRTKRRRNEHRSCQLPAPRRLCFLFQTLLLVAFLLATFIAIARPSYSNAPARYHELRLRVQSSSEAGRANPGKEKVFIATTIFDPSGDLARGAWGESILSLIDLLGPSNVFLSIYENGAGRVAEAALKEFGRKAKCERAIIFEDELALNVVPHIQLPDGTSRVKRIAYLAEVRNRALRPLDSSTIKYDKLLYLNDVVFDPINAAQLLFATNAASGKAEYRAACSMDFSNPFKFYDTFASRDFEGYSMGLPIYPWFSSAGKSQSRQDVFDQKDAVRVKSCWGGMVAFDAKFFQLTADAFDDLDTAGSIDGANFTGFRFRSETDLFRESAECCLFQADIQSPESDDTGIYMNPYIRVAYDTRTLSWLRLSRRIERLYTPFQYMINIIVGLPRYNPRRAQQPWQEVHEKVWAPNATLPAGGSFEMMERIAPHDGFCGTTALQVLKEEQQPGEKNWEFIPVPNA